MKHWLLRSDPADHARDLGRVFAPLFYGFVRYVMESAALSGTERVYYFTREGDFFAALHESIARYDDTVRFPESRILPVSRLATFAASLHEVSIAEFDRIWWLYPNQSLGAFLKTIGLSPERLGSLPVEFHLNLDDPIPGIAEDERVIRLFADPRFRFILQGHIAAKRALLQRLLDENGITPDSPAVTVVDIGWSGSIQSNLAHLRPNTRFDGFYFSVREPECGLPPNVTRRCFLEDVVTHGASKEIRDALFRIGPLELLCNSPLGTVIGYAIQDDRLDVLRRPDEKENVTFYEFTRFFQHGVFERVAELSKGEPQTSLALRGGSARRLLATLLYDPPKAIANEYLRLHHDETFGLGGFVNPNDRVPWSLVLGCLFLKRARRWLNDRLRAMGWSAGSLVASNMRPLQWWIIRKRYPFLFAGDGKKATDDTAVQESDHGARFVGRSSGLAVLNYRDSPPARHSQDETARRAS